LSGVKQKFIKSILVLLRRLKGKARKKSVRNERSSVEIRDVRRQAGRAKPRQTPRVISRILSARANFYFWQSSQGECTVTLTASRNFERTPKLKMWQQFQPALGEPTEWLGDWHPLAEQLGSTNGLVALSEVSASMQVPLVHDLASLRRFLLDYQKQILLPHELPAIQRAFDHTCRHEVRELAAFDRLLANEAALKPFTDASRRVGQTELLKLRPLRDERIVRRYLEAVERGEASAWHTLVYGLTLALYSIPLRQGLLGYGFQTSRGFIYSAAKALQLSEKDCRALLEELCGNLPDAVETLIAQRAAA
jgi:urease accessory protein UreF